MEEAEGEESRPAASSSKASPRAAKEPATPAAVIGVGDAAHAREHASKPRPAAAAATTANQHQPLLDELVRKLWAEDVVPPLGCRRAHARAYDWAARLLPPLRGTAGRALRLLHRAGEAYSEP